MSDSLAMKLIVNNFSFFTGVPCSLLSDFIKEIEEFSEKNQIVYVSALREDVAVGLAAGAALAGKKSVVFMQNSGLGVSVNAIASLIEPCSIPILYIISMRGFYPDKDTEENRIMGLISTVLLKNLNIDYCFWDEDKEHVIQWALERIENGKSAAILIKTDNEF